MHQIESKIPFFTALICGLMVAVLFGQFVSGVFGNPISAIAPLVAVAVMFTAIVNYKMGFLWIIVVSGYLDAVKRLLFLDANISMEDVTKVLAMAPVATAGLFLGAYIPSIVLRRRAISDPERKIFMTACVGVFLFAIATYMKTKDRGETITTVGQSGIYFLMVPIVYSMYQRREVQHIEKLLKFVLVAFIPVALYGLWQVVFGYSQLEITYMMSGMTLTSGLLSQLGTRPFSTLNSPQAYGTMMFFLMVIGLYIARTTTVRRPVWMGVFGLFLVADALSTTRGATIFSFVAAAMMFWFASRRKTKFFYFATITPVLLVIINAQWLLDNIVWLDSFLPQGTDYQQQMFNIQSVSERLKGYINVLQNPAMWTLLGHGGYEFATASANDEAYNHDALSQFLLRFGALGLLVLFTFIIGFLWQLHKRLLSIHDVKKRQLASVLTVIVVIFMISNVLGGGFQVFPINFYFFIFLGLICAICFRGSELVRVEDPSALRASAPKRRGGQFASVRRVPGQRVATEQ